MSSYYYIAYCLEDAIMNQVLLCEPLYTQKKKDNPSSDCSVVNSTATFCTQKNVDLVCLNRQVPKVILIC